MGSRGPKPRGELDWYRRVAELMVNEFMSFSAAAQATGQKFTTAQEEHVHEFSEAFRNLLTGMHIEYFVEIGATLAQTPGAVKDYVSGVAVAAIRKLGEQGNWDKVGVPLKELSDLYGLKQVQADTPVFANLSQKDIEELRQKAQAQQKAKEAEQEQTTKIAIGPSGKPN